MNYTDTEIKNAKLKFKSKKTQRWNISKNLSVKGTGYLVLLAYVVVSIYPFFWSVFTSFNNPHLISGIGMNPFPSSGEWTAENYTTLFNGAAKNFITPWISNTIIYSLTSSLLNSVLNLLAGYALAQIAMRGKKLVMNYLLVSILVPSQATFIPTYYIFTKLGLIGGDVSTSMFMFAIIFSGMANIILTFMARQFFLTQTAELEEAAQIEGYSRLSVFLRITLKKMLPLFFTQIVLVFMGAWNNYLTFTLYSGGEPGKMTINSGILNIAQTAVDQEVGYGQMLALSNISFVPMMAVYLLSLKVQLRGIKGGNK